MARALSIFHESLNEIGVNPAREHTSMSLIGEGVRKWMEYEYLEPESIPRQFLFQTLAVIENNEQGELMEKLLNSKSLRNSRDSRRTVIWFLEDYRHQEKYMREFYHVVRISSGKKVVKNIARLSNTLPIIYLIDPSFTLKGIDESDQFNEVIDNVFRSFIDRRKLDETVKAKFVDRIEELHKNGFLEAVLNLYSKYAEYREVLPLLDIALAAVIMNDFEKVKFPTTKGIKSMTYLNKEQMEILMGAVDQLAPMDNKSRMSWMTDDVAVKAIAEESVDEVEQARKNMTQRIADLKYHFELSMHERKGKAEKIFSFDDEYISQLRGWLGGLEDKSSEFRKLKQIESIVVSINELEKIDISEVKEKQAEIKKCLRKAANATRTLFVRYYDFDEDELQSLQAKMDISLLYKLLLGEKEKLNIESLKAYESSDHLHLILSGKEPENCGSCQRFDGTPSLMIGLSGYLLNSSVKIIRVENQDGIVMGRSMLRVVNANGKPVLFLERAYYRNVGSNPNVDSIIVEVAIKKAKSMGIPLMTTWRATNKSKKVIVERFEGLSRYEYSDGLGGAGAIDMKTKRKMTLDISILS